MIRIVCTADNHLGRYAEMRMRGDAKGVGIR